VTGTSIIDGYVHPQFLKVADVFHQQIERTDGGAAVAVYHRGELVVDLWGGRRTDEGVPWTRDTLAMCFSTTKGVVATGLHILADRGSSTMTHRWQPTGRSSPRTARRRSPFATC
jgi:CubicO group peptidase (beta-lactamase class C family)